MRTKKSNFLLISAIAFALVTLVIPAQAAVWDSTRVYTGTVQTYDLAVGSKLKGASDDTVRIFTTQYHSPYQILLFTDRSTALPMNWVTDIVFTDTSGNIGAAIGDPDRDGQNELLFGRCDLPYRLRMSKWNGSAWITSPIATFSYPIYDIAVGDANNDGSNDDIIVATAYAVFRVRWNGASWDITTLKSGIGIYGVAIGNFDAAHAGNEIVAVTMMSQAFRIRWTGAAWDTLTIYYNSSPSVYDVTVGDFDASNPGDEIALSSSHYSSSTHGAVIELYGSGTSWSTRDLYSPSDWGTFAEIAAGDFYAGNAGAEIAAISGSGDSNQVRLIYGSGTSWHNEKIMGTGGMYNYGVAIGNVNRYRPEDELAVGGNRNVWEAEERIEGGAHYAITPESLHIEALEGQYTTDSLTVSNPGGQINLSYKMTDPAAWLSENPDIAEIPPNDSLIVTVSVDGYQLIAGDYYTEIAVKTNAVNQQYDTVPVFVHVGPDPEMEVSPDSFYLQERPDDQIYEYFEISNVGGGVIEYDITYSGNSWLSVSPDSGSVLGGEADTVTLTINTTGLDGHYYDTLRVISNSGGIHYGDTVLVPVHLWVTWPIFIAHFMTPEGEPYPFDVTISDGEWVQVFDSVTYCSTAVPETATYTFVGGGLIMRSRFFFSPGEVREFEVYYYYYSQMELRTRPYILHQEMGANPVLSWEYDSLTDILHLTLQREQGKSVCVGIVYDNLQEPPYYAVSYGPEPSPPPPPPQPDPHCNWRSEYPQIGFTPPGSEWTDSLQFFLFDPGYGAIRRAWVMDNDNILYQGLGIIDTLRDLQGTHYPRNYTDPQYVVPPGNYVLSYYPDTLDPNYCIRPHRYDFTINVKPGRWEKLYNIYLPKTAELDPFTFYVVAEGAFAHSSYSNLFHAPEDSITVDVSTETRYDWWGAFVLPKNLVVDKLFAYSDTLGEEELEDTIDYITNPVEGSNLFLVVVRNQFYYDRLKLEYTSRGDVNADGSIDAVDVVYLINYLYIHGPAPIPLEAGDVDCDGVINAADVVYLINYLYIDGPPPCS
jgi:hypothetical protein